MIYPKTIKIDDYIMNFKLGTGVEALSRNRDKLLGIKEFIIRYRSIKEEFIYEINYIEI